MNQYIYPNVKDCKLCNGKGCGAITDSSSFAIMLFVILFLAGYLIMGCTSNLELRIRVLEEKLRACACASNNSDQSYLPGVFPEYRGSRKPITSHGRVIRE